MAKAALCCGQLSAVSMLLAGALAALASSEGTPPPRERLIEDPPPRRAEQTPRRPQGIYAPCPGPRGTIHRKHLVAILERGPGVFLGGVEVVMVPTSALSKAALVAWPDLLEKVEPKGGLGGVSPPKGGLSESSPNWRSREKPARGARDGGKARPVSPTKGGQEGPPLKEYGGWKVLGFHPGDPCLGRAGIRPGDVVLSANGNRLRSPEDLMALWAELRQTQNLVLRLLRGDEPLTFVVRVYDASP